MLGRAFHLLLISFIFLTSFLLYAEGETIHLNIGKKKSIVVEGYGFFSSDESIVSVSELPPNRIEIVGISGGSAQIYYWKDGALSYIDIEIAIPETLTTSGFGPQFLGNKPYFTYDLQNSSSFSEKTFFDKPSFSHGLSSYVPAGRGHVQQFLTYSHQGTGSTSLPSGKLLYSDRNHRFSFGQTSVSLSRILSSVMSGASFVGSNLQFLGEGRQSFQTELNLFGGVKQQADLLETNSEEQNFGANLSFSRQREGTLLPDLVNMSLFTYQLPGEKQYQLGGTLEERFHLNRNFSIGSGFTRGKGGFAGTLTTLLEKKAGLFKGEYLYLNHGLEQIGGGRIENDRHKYEFQGQKVLKDNTTFVGGSLTHNISVHQEDSTQPSNNALNGQLFLKKQLSFQKGFGISYSVNRTASEGIKTVSNAFTGNLTYPLLNQLYLSHGLSYSRADLSARFHQVAASTTLSFESSQMRSDTTVNFNFSRGQTQGESLTAQESLQFYTGKGQLQLGLSYNKNKLRDGDHSLQFTPSLTYQLTSVHLLSLNGSSAVNLGSNNTFNGALGIQYRYFFGAGVQKDSLWKQFLSGGKKQDVTGRLFMDNNYDYYYDKSDQPLSSVPISLGGKTTKTDEEGKFLFPQVKKGVHTLSVKPSDVSTSQKISLPEKQILEVTYGPPLIVPIPVVIERASIRVKVLIDSNNNGKEDEQDTILPLSKIIFQSESGVIRSASGKGGGKTFKGIEVGRHLVSLDPFDFPDDMELTEEEQVEVVVNEIKDYEVVFLFRPIRALSGEIVALENLILPPSIRVRVGSNFSDVDEDGYYWIKNLETGEHTITIDGLPYGYCIDKNTRTWVSIPEGGYIERKKIYLTNKCP